MRKLSEYSAAADGNRTLDEAMDEVRRELDVRRRIYDRWIMEGKLSRTEAMDRMCRLLTAMKALVELDQTMMQLEAANRKVNQLQLELAGISGKEPLTVLDTAEQIA